MIPFASATAENRKCPSVLGQQSAEAKKACDMVSSEDMHQQPSGDTRLCPRLSVLHHQMGRLCPLKHQSLESVKVDDREGLETMTIQQCDTVRQTLPINLCAYVE